MRESARKLFDTLFNTYKFFALYANVEAWEPSDADPAPADRPLIDRWLLSRLDTLTKGVMDELDAYQITRAYRELGDFVVEDLSNWYVRRCRPRYWGNSDAADARAAFRTLYDALRMVSLLAAPCVPFAADWLHHALTGESVHLQRYPRRPEGGDAALEADMELARTLVSLGRSAREEVKIRVRQPLRTLHAVVPGGRALDGGVLELVRDELNVKNVAFLDSAEALVRLVARPNFRNLGPRFGKSTQLAADAIRALPQDALSSYRDGGEVTVSVNGTDHVLQEGDLDVDQEATGDLLVKSEGRTTVALDPALDDELRSEGLARELVNRIQRLRKDAGLEITDRIELLIAGDGPVAQAVEAHGDFIAGETLAVSVAVGDGAGWPHVREVDLDGVAAGIALRTATG